MSEGRRAATTRERRHQVHQLLDSGVGLLDCARRPTLVDPYREHLRRRRCHPHGGR
ncbi:hypothetical protein [Streptomyces melanogenes]|uniref:hypothetical protein n=1 Tax=Streptomyces melanogenes TaxID=67326 RepID=UPI0035715F29